MVKTLVLITPKVVREKIALESEDVKVKTNKNGEPVLDERQLLQVTPLKTTSTQEGVSERREYPKARGIRSLALAEATDGRRLTIIEGEQPIVKWFVSDDRVQEVSWEQGQVALSQMSPGQSLLAWVLPSELTGVSE